MLSNLRTAQLTCIFYVVSKEGICMRENELLNEQFFSWVKWVLYYHPLFKTTVSSVRHKKSF